MTTHWAQAASSDPGTGWRIRLTEVQTGFGFHGQGEPGISLFLFLLCRSLCTLLSTCYVYFCTYFLTHNNLDQQKYLFMRSFEKSALYSIFSVALRHLSFHSTYQHQSVNGKVFQKTNCLPKTNSRMHHASAMGLVWKDLKGFLILTKFRGSSSQFRFDYFYIVDFHSAFSQPGHEEAEWKSSM